jgi:L-asparaginase II
MVQSAPLTVEVTRGEMVESRHRVAAAVCDAGGARLLAAGDADALIYPRSAIKPLQALVLIESGAADAFNVSDAEVALACASHSGEPRHVELVRAWLARLGLSEADLECGVHAVTGVAAPTAAHNNCSGKHSGFLTVARHLGVPTRGYIQPDHPVQRRVMARVAEMAGATLDGAPRGIDGCGIPVFGMPLAALAGAMARLAAAPDAACARIRAAMAAEPALVAGTGRFTTRVIAATSGAVLVKEGAEGVYAGAIPARGIGIAVKAEDGTGRAATAAMGHLLRRLGALDERAGAALADVLEPTLRNHAGREVGRIRVR